MNTTPGLGTERRFEIISLGLGVFVRGQGHSLVLRDDVEAEALVDRVGDALDARLQFERLVRNDLRRRLVVGDHAKLTGFLGAKEKK